MIDLRSLRHASALARHGHYSSAAKTLGITQSALSRSIFALEEELGVRLFDRDRRGVEPTAYGKVLLRRADPLLGDAADLEREIRLAKGVERDGLRVAAGPYAADISVAIAVGRLLAQHPETRITLSTSTSQRMGDALQNREIDLAIGEVASFARVGGLTVIPLPVHPILLCCRRGHPLADRDKVMLSEIKRFPIVNTLVPPRLTAQIRKVFANSGDPHDYGTPQPPIYVEDLALARSVVANSDAIGLWTQTQLTRAPAESRLVALPIHLNWLHTAYGFAHRRDRSLSRAAELLIQSIREIEADVTESERGSARAAIDASNLQPVVGH